MISCEKHLLSAANGNKRAHHETKVGARVAKATLVRNAEVEPAHHSIVCCCIVRRATSQLAEFPTSMRCRHGNTGLYFFEGRRREREIGYVQQIFFFF
ncbi:hypothetical protein BC940DRAFT_303240 [Gongronella butleri]|nr:hypothetical protein BC940DRAFT_303240 [Gongronella butleri]